MPAYKTCSLRVTGVACLTPSCCQGHLCKGISEHCSPLSDTLKRPCGFKIKSKPVEGVPGLPPASPHCAPASGSPSPSWSRVAGSARLLGLSFLPLPAGLECVYPGTPDSAARPPPALRDVATSPTPDPSHTGFCPFETPELDLLPP